MIAYTIYYKIDAAITDIIIYYYDVLKHNNAEINKICIPESFNTNI